MSKYTEPSLNRPKAPPVAKKPPEPLDKLAQLANFDTKVCKREIYKKRCRSKYVSNGLAIRLANVEGTVLEKSYWNTFHCAEGLQQTGRTLTGRYCGNRWCLPCNNIRTAKLINSYIVPLERLSDKQFVTLTVKNVSGKKLKETIELMQKVFVDIMSCFKARRTPIVGIRKIECTYNTKRNDYHPHFHIILSGKSVAEELLCEWLRRTARLQDELITDIKGQDIRPANDEAVKELFKYFTKLLSTTDGKKGFMPPESLDIIFTAMRGKRVFQGMGIKSCSEEIEKISSQIVEDLEEGDAVWIFNDKLADYFNFETGESLCDYVISETIKKLRGNSFVDSEEIKKEFSQ